MEKTLEQFIPWSEYLDDDDFNPFEPPLTHQHDRSVDAGTFSFPGEEWSYATQNHFSTLMELSETDFPVNDSSFSDSISFQNTSYNPANLEVFSSANTAQPSIEDKSNMLQRKSRPVFSSDAHVVVRAWLDSHADDPFPTNEEKEQFSHSLHLSIKQISTLFNNERRRYNKIDSHDLKCSLPSSLSFYKGIYACKSDGPMERYLSSPPEEDPQPLERVANAAAHLEALANSVVNSDTHSRTKRYSKRRKLARSEDGTSSDMTSRSDISTGQASSLYSENSYSSYASGKKVKRRTHAARPLPSRKGRYYCTHCWKNFDSNEAWRKHEATVHMPQYEFEYHMAELTPTFADCGGCEATLSGCRWTLCHNYKACQNRPKEARTFYRKDHFENHMSHIHNASIAPTIASWGQPTVHKKMGLCGFCGKRFPTWIERINHMGQHYRDNGDFDQSKWKFTWEARDAEEEDDDQKQEADLQLDIMAFLNHFQSTRKPSRPALKFGAKDEMFASGETVGLRAFRHLESNSSATCGCSDVARECLSPLSLEERNSIISRRPSLEGISAWRFGFEEVDGITFIVP